jgi:hypothetical protein
LKKFKKRQSQVKHIWKRLINPTVDVGDTQYPKKQSDQAKVGFRWDLDVPVITADGRKANRFKLQPNAQAQSSSIQEYIRHQGKKGTHTDITSVDIPTDASEEEAKKLVEDAIDSVHK